MLKWIKLAGVGPADKMHAELAPRINVITGDNGLGKSFLLDVAWWALTRTWAGTPAIPTRNKRVATISYVVRGDAKDAPIVRSEFRFDTQTWAVDEKRPPPPSGIVIYARVDGGFSVWDPARNGERPVPAAGVKSILSLSAPDEPIAPGDPRRVYVGEGRERPTIVMNGREVPIALASAGVRRVLAIAYLLVWAWREHKLEVELQHLGEPEHRLVFLFDEPETHLHPRWQRSILPALLHTANELRSLGEETQLVTATHSPLAMASLEPVFDAECDAWLDLDLVPKDGAAEVKLTRRAFILLAHEDRLRRRPRPVRGGRRSLCA
jgi:hypothetical protein